MSDQAHLSRRTLAAGFGAASAAGTTWSDFYAYAYAYAWRFS